MLNVQKSGTRKMPFIGLLAFVLIGGLFSGYVVAQEDTKHYLRLAIGSFGDFSREHGGTGGARFSGTTLSVNAMPEEAPLLVAVDSKGVLTVRPNGNVVINKDLVVYGKKQFANPHPTDPNKIIKYVALEGPEVGTYVRGTSQLTEGRAVIPLPDHFALITSEKQMTVSLTPLDEWLQLFVVEKTPNYIVVKEVQGKSGQFDYRVQGLRKGYENHQVVSAKNE